MSIACVIQVTSLPLRKSTGIAQLQVHPLITHTLVQMLKVKRLGLGKYAVKLETLYPFIKKTPTLLHLQFSKRPKEPPGDYPIYF